MPVKPNRGQGASPISAVPLNGKISWFGGPNDHESGPTTASGAPVTTPGIAVYNHATLGGYWKVTTPNGRTRVIQQTDIGPAPWTGRVIDFTYSALKQFGYTESNFPTNSTAHAVYLGKDKNSAIKAAGGNAVEASQQITSGGEVAPSVGAGTIQNASLLSDGENLLDLLKDLVTGNLGDLGAKLAMTSLSIVKDFGVGFADLIIAPAWHWNQRATSYYAGYVLDPRRVGDKSEYQWAFAWTAAFWGFGYILLWTESGSGSLKPVAVHRARIARHVRRAQALPARRSLVKPKDVKAHTPAKPKPFTSRAEILPRGTMSTTRNRQVKVHASGAAEQQPAKQQTEQTSTVPVAQVATEKTSDTKPHKAGPTGRGAHGNVRPATKEHSKGSRKQRGNTRRR
jgi:hypothetical protein